MNTARRLAIIVALTLAFISNSRPFAAAAEPTKSSAQTALQKHAFPWYDVKQDNFRPLDPVEEAKKDEKPKPDPDHKPRDDSSDGLFQSTQKILMWGVLITVIIIMAVVAIRTWQDSNLGNSNGSSEATISLEALEALPEPVRKIHDLLGEAMRLAAASDFNKAMLFYYSWQLVQLDRRQWIELQKGKTNRQYRRELMVSSPQLTDLFSSSIRLFEDAFFGQLPIRSEDFQQVWEHRDRFEFHEKGER